MHWILASERSDEKELAIDGIPQIIEHLDLNFDYGIKITDLVPLIDIPYSSSNNELKTDNIIVAPRIGLLINKKMEAILDSLNIENIQYYSTRLINNSSSEIDESYKIANVIGKIACVDKENSDLEFYADGEIQFIDKLALNLEKNKNYGHIFRLAEFSPIIVISNILKTKIEEANITGFKLYAPEEFDL